MTIYECEVKLEPLDRPTVEVDAEDKDEAMQEAEIEVERNKEHYEDMIQAVATSCKKVEWAEHPR